MSIKQRGRAMTQHAKLKLRLTRARRVMDQASSEYNKSRKKWWDAAEKHLVAFRNLREFESNLKKP